MKNEEYDCPECEGVGEVECEYTDMLGKTHGIITDCPVCEGYGTVDKNIYNLYFE